METEGCLVQAPTPDCHFHLSSLSTAQSLLLNPSTSVATVQSTVESIILSLPRLAADPTSLSLALSVLTQAASRHPSLTQRIVSSIRSLVNGQDRSTSAVLTALLSIARTSLTDDGFDVLLSVLDENVLLSLASSCVYKVRSRILRLLVFIVGRWQSIGASLRDEVIVRVFVGFTGDIYAMLRRDAIDGLFVFLTVAGAGVDICVADCCLKRALSLMGDDDELVRSAAVRLVGLCGEILEKNEKMDTIFTQVCCMARDMSVRVRMETFKALGKLKLVSDSILTQSLSKKILGDKNGGKSLVKLDEKSKPSFSSAAGAYIHGIEDEFYEVRKAACRSLGIHAVLSVKFADVAINLLMDLMNDDVEVVRLEALNSLFHMGAHECLNVHEKHMHMFLGLLTDVSAAVRHWARKVLQLMKLPKFDIFKSTVNELIANLEKHPEEEEDIFVTLFALGKNHQRFSLSIAKNLVNQIEQRSKADLALDSPSIAATLVACIASPLSKNETAPHTPAVLFSYAIPLLGRIAHALQGTIGQDFLLTFLLEHSQIKWKSQDLKSEIDGNQNNEALMQSIIKFISKSIGDACSSIKRYNGNDAKRILRCCTKEIEMISLDAMPSASTTLEFLSKYILILQLLSELWCKFEPRNSTRLNRNYHILLEKLDSSLRRMLYSFTDWPKEVECHILELNLLLDVFRLSLAGNLSYNYLRNLRAKNSHLEAFSFLSDFSKEVKKSIDGGNSGIIHLHGLLELFEFRELEFEKDMKSIKAELEVVAGNDSEKPLKFVPGLPVGIRCCITLHNTSNTDRLWLRMSVGGRSVQYVFLDMSTFEGSEEVRKCTSLIPFYETSKVASFEIRVCVVIECLLEYYKIDKEREGMPKYEVTELSLESIVYLSRVKK